ncbi:MAG TPA: trypsin-like serine protease [Bacteroidales bacterium]|nr:trypsin-like serine protease [Bacteroidales bacterium]HOS73183.1 trypsin-like serine protease [Bacteroidales bacterium]HQH23740.1 trypsin-like serine protease [Bacteroidales bacterium]HQJ83411.1 trypsin-like serine protease [Bacteroidales bacterium]
MIQNRIKHSLSAVFFVFVSAALFSQKVSVEILKTEDAAVSGWQILDGQYRKVISGNDFSRGDSLLFSLEAEKRYLLAISLSDNLVRDTTLYLLMISGEPVLRINSGLEPGDHFFPFFTGVKKEAGKIVGGTDADIADFPWQVYYEAGQYICGGSIISEDWVITAAHCTRNKDGTAVPLNEMFVKAGATNPYQAQSGKKYLISEVIVHENFNNRTLDNDLALLRLQHPVDVVNAKAVRLLTAADALEGATDPGVMTWVTGWGLTQVFPEEFPWVLQKVQLPIVSKEQASVVWKNISDNVVMAGYRNADRDACNGDSGGPLVVSVSGEYRLAGITSWGSEDCDTYSAYTRISAYEDWIRTNTGISEYIPPVPAGGAIICPGTVSSEYSVNPVSGAQQYQWELYPADAGSISFSAASATVEWDQDYLGPASIKLRVVINNRLSEWSRLNVEVAPATRIITQPGDRTLCAGQNIDLGITAEGHNLEYHRYKNGILTNIFADGDYFIAGALTDDSGIYRCMVTGSCGTAYTNDISIAVHPLTRIKSFSRDMTIDSGDDVKLEVDASGHELSYQWIKDRENLAGSNEPDLWLTNANSSDIGLYQVMVSGSCGTELSGRAYVYVRQEDSAPDPGVIVWPTITDGVINAALDSDESYNIRIFSYTGRIIRELNNCRYNTVIYMNNQPSGIYIINIYNRHFRWSQKFIRK